MGLYVSEQFGEESVKYYFLMSKWWFKVGGFSLECIIFLSPFQTVLWTSYHCCFVLCVFVCVLRCS